MKIVVPANGADLDSEASPIFGRCLVYVFLDTETMAYEALENPAIGAAGGAGIQAAQFVIEHGARAVVTGNVGPNALNIFQAADVPVSLFQEGTVREAAEAFRAGRLSAITAPSAPAHAGMGGGRRTGMGRGMGAGRSMGVGRGTGMVRPTPPPTTSSGEEETAALKQTVGDLRRQLAEVLQRLDQLEKGA
jgi:predicted Fe-Mo cluster-binding NifX family protein